MTDKDDPLQRQGTHSDGCYAFGHRHYECALVEIERLRAEVAEQRRERFRDFSYLTASESQARAECEEQARLNGMGSEREAALMSRATRAESELAAIKLRLIEDCDAARDFPANTCGASRHAQMIAESLISGVPYAMLTDDPAYCGQSILSTVKSLFTARTELAALRGRIAAAPVVCIDNGACVTDGARLTIAGGDTYFVHAELCGKRVRLVVDEG